MLTRAGVEGIATAASWRDPAGRAVARRRACAAMALPAPARVACGDGGDLPGRAAAGHFAVASPRSVRPRPTQRGPAGDRIRRLDRTSVGAGKGGSDRVDMGGGGLIKKK